jgi:hypothetical protein
MNWRLESRDWWAVFSGITCVLCIIGAFITESGLARWIQVLAAVQTGVSCIYGLVYRPPRTPFHKVYVHDDWHPAANDHDYPRLYIPADVHGMGRNPHVEFDQGDHVFPFDRDGEGNVIIYRDNYSIGPFANLGITIREHR